MKAMIAQTGGAPIHHKTFHNAAPRHTFGPVFKGPPLTTKISKVKMPKLPKIELPKIGNPFTALSKGLGYETGQYFKSAAKSSGFSVTRDLKNVASLGGSSGSVTKLANSAKKTLTGNLPGKTSTKINITNYLPGNQKNTQSSSGSGILSMLLAKLQSIINDLGL